jgi:glyoxylase-like metal-dependent hydrolase (beta-lactamase superfamily II)
MKIINLTEKSNYYTSNVFLVMGAWNTISDLNTLIDVGCDFSVIEKIENINTGLGKKKIDQVILTHSHSDHAALLPTIKELYHPMVYAFNSHLSGVDHILTDGDTLKIGDKQFEVFHISAHSYDSICLLCEEEGILFAGDTSFPISFENETLYTENFHTLSRLQKKVIKIIHKGHGPSQQYLATEFAVVNQQSTRDIKPLC